MSFPDFSMVVDNASLTPWLPALEAMLKVTFLFAAAGVAAMALNRASAAVRHHIWLLAIVSALVLPVLSLALPRWQMPLVKVAAPGPTAAPAPLPEEPLAARAPSRRTPNVEAPAAAASRSSAGESQAVAPAATAPAAPARAPLSPVMWLLAIWAAGAAVVLSRLLLGIAAVQWMSLRTARVVDAPWLPLAQELASELGVTTRLTFVESRKATMPMAWGIIWPSVLMPADAVRWPVERLRIVLLHELAHVKRRDCLTNVIAQIACAVYWFNPLAWIAARHIRTERERACDDLVLAAGTRGTDYAEELLEIARVMRAGRFPALMAGATLAMAHRSQLEGRLMAILDPRLPRSGVSRVRTALAAALVACALPPLATLQPWAVVEAAPAVLPVFDSSTTPSMSVTSAPDESQKAPTPPRPAPQPNPDPNPMPSSSSIAQIGPTVAQAIADAVSESTSQAAIQNISQAAIQGALQGAEGSVQTIVQGALQGALQGTAELIGQEAKRAASDPRMIAALTAALKDTDKDVREAALHALVKLRDPAIYEPLVQALKDAAADVREQAVHGLGQLRDRRAVEPLMSVLKDVNPGVRESALHALGQFRDPRAVDAIAVALKDENPGVREQAAFALGQIRDKRAAPALSAAVKDPNADVREKAVFALGQIRDVSAIEGLMAALRDSKPDVRQQAAFALGQIRDPRAVEPLISALKDEAPDVRQQAAFSLGQIRDKSAVEALTIAVKDASADVREQVVFALGQIRDPRAIEALTLALKDSSASVRQQAAFALGQIAR